MSWPARSFNASSIAALSAIQGSRSASLGPLCGEADAERAVRVEA